MSETFSIAPKTTIRCTLNASDQHHYLIINYDEIVQKFAE
jgi:hypothetical protein